MWPGKEVVPNSPIDQHHLQKQQENLTPMAYLTTLAMMMNDDDDEYDDDDDDDEETTTINTMILRKKRGRGTTMRVRLRPLHSRC